MTVLVKNSKSLTQSEGIMQSHGKTESGLKTDEVNEFNMQSNRDRKKVNVLDVMRCDHLMLM